MASSVTRMTGMSSGLDTESIVSALTSSYQTKVDQAKKDQTKLEWKQDAWKDMNSQIYNLYSGKLSAMRYETNYAKKVTTTSNKALTVVAGNGATDGVQSAKIISMAKAGYLTGAEITTAEKGKVTQDTKLTELGIAKDSVISISVGGKTTDITVTEDMTMFGFTSKLKEAGVNANFDIANKRLFVSSQNTGADADFEITSSSADILDKLGISETSGATKIDGKDAELELNGATFKSSTNSFTINGSTYQINAMTDEEISITTANDTTGTYDMIKDFLKQYNETMAAMSSAYNAEANKYEPLTDEEKAVLSEKQIDDWEKKAKEALLRKDSALNDIMSAMKRAMSESVVIDGKTYSLADFGIATAGYFSVDEKDRNSYHIYGDKSDLVYSDKEDKLSAALAEDPELVGKVLSEIAKKVYSAIDGKMKSTDYSSVYKVYDDKKMKKDYDSYKTKIAELEAKLTAAEDRYYKKFSKMETMLANINSNNNYLSGLFS